ncbi:MAG: tRNA (N(6)-L-threonylcarbamoyladenosine(37)-C(2))-methylthiotransferase MtaB, partial [Dehalococcoidales bacterium]|nr:tRNA (N(6)-L-threonylcarbamoyladenosine(37)-C(2))-methylthiotransferase MtaB [Dehalococcoidales bacterium]
MINGKVSIDYLGCKLNQAEVEALGIDFMRAGYQPVSSDESADVCLLNSCTVTHVADRKSRQWIRRTRRANPSALIIVTGCYAQRAYDEIKQIDQNVVIVDNQNKMGMVDWLLREGHLKENPPGALADSGQRHKTRSLVRIQHGCTNRCAYCIVPLVRQECFSRTRSEVLNEIDARVEAGYAEIVLTGTEIGSYNSGGMRLKELVLNILQSSPVKRLRLSSLQPHHLQDGLLDLWDDERLCPHFHVSLQSGSDAVLKRMNRHYSRDSYKDIAQRIHQKVADAAITTDVIVGFPGETQADFEETVDLCEEIGFARIHVFPYSSRPMTQAIGMEPVVSEQDKKKRGREMLSIAEKASRGFRQKFEGRVMPVLWESCSGGLFSGLTPN